VTRRPGVAETAKQYRR